jgi:hypothetical protein
MAYEEPGARVLLVVVGRPLENPFTLTTLELSART